MTEPEPLAAGWDLGGAHLKLALASGDGHLAEVVQVPCPLWQGLERLTESLEQLRPRLGPVRRHALTMTGELTDLFASRAEGVERLIGAFGNAFPDADLRVFAGRAGLLTPAAASARPAEVASANWLASAALAAARLPQGLFLDIGSTTTDLVPFHDGRIVALGTTDAERLACEELVYTGVARTPVLAVAASVPYAGERQGLAAEVFATMADVYRLTGELPADADQMPSADGRAKTPEASARRLARMLGRDVEPQEMSAWRRVAARLAEAQRRTIEDAAARVLSRAVLDDAAPIVGAGVGRFLAAKLARAMSARYVDLSDLVLGAPEVREKAACCAPAAALALLASEGW